MASVEINNTTLLYVGRPNWDDQTVGGYLTGEVIHNRWRRHIWEANVMPIAEFNSLYAFEGQQVSILTTNYTDRNDTTLKRYYAAELKKVTGAHDGPRFTGVRAEFIVRI